MGLTPGCQCDACVMRWVSALILHAVKLEKAVLRAKALIDAGQIEMAHALVARAAELAAERDLCGELRIEQEARNLLTAAEKRSAGRLN